jgi:ADP-ribose pyrophosphatase
MPGQDGEGIADQMMNADINDPRLIEPLCDTLLPVETVHENNWFSVRNRGGHYTIEYNQPQVIVLPVVDNKAIVMVRVFRPVIADTTLELPAGGVEKNEAPVEAAMREFREETGIRINDKNRFRMLPPLIHMMRSPCLPYYFHVHLTEDEYNSRSAHDEETESVEYLEFSEILKRIIKGEIYIGLHIAMISIYLMKNSIESFHRLNDEAV